MKHFGHGVINAGDGKTVLVHRLAWTLARGPIPDGMEVCHSCDNPPCVNDSHFFLGTQSDNSKDMWAKGRGRRFPIRYGERHHFAKMTEALVAALRSEYVKGSLTHGSGALSRKYGIHYSTVCRIVRGETWRAA
jgi:hypothetical protein